MSDKPSTRRPRKNRRPAPETPTKVTEVKDFAKGALKEGAQGLAGWTVFGGLGMALKKVFELLSGQLFETAATKATEAAMEHFKGSMAEKFRRKHDDWLRILGQMNDADRQELLAWIGDASKVDKSFHDHIVNTYVDYITRDVPTNDKGLVELDDALILEAAGQLEAFIAHPVTDDAFGNEDRLVRMHGMCGYYTPLKNRFAGTGGKIFGALMEARRQANHAIDPTHPDFQP